MSASPARRQFPTGPDTTGGTPATSVTYDGSGQPWPNPPGTPNTAASAMNLLLAMILALRDTIVIASLNTSGTFTGGDWIGPGGGTSSTSSPYGFFGCGFARIATAGVLKSFSLSSSAVPGSDIPFDIYKAPNGDPTLLTWTGLTVTLATGAYTATLTADLTVAVGDILAVTNSGLGYTSGGLQLTAARGIA